MLCNGLKYSEHLKKMNSATAMHHMQLMPARSHLKDATVETVMATGNEKNILVQLVGLRVHPR